MATLDSLPNELILAVIEQVSSPTLLSLNLVNRHLHNLTLEHLYATFSCGNASLFLRTLVLASPTSRYDLARLVKNVEWDMEPTRTAGNRLSSLDRWAIADLHRQLNLSPPTDGQDPFDVRFTRHVRGEPVSEHWFLDEIFLASLPNATTLKIANAWQWDDHTYWFTNTAAQLTRVVIDGPLRIENIHPLLKMPSLRDLELEEVIDMRQEPDKLFPWDEPGRCIDLRKTSSGLEKLTLRSSYVPTRALAIVLDAIKALRCFEYEHSINLLSIEEVKIDFSRLARALLRHEPSLERFQVSLNATMLVTKVSDLEHFDLCSYVTSSASDSD